MHQRGAVRLCAQGEPVASEISRLVGVPVATVPMMIPWEDAERSPLVLINPEITEPEGSVVWTEGCLSVPDFEAEVERAERIRLRALDLDGAPVDILAEGLQAVCFQHEVDHLDGILFIDHISRLKRSRYVHKRKKQLQRDEEEALV